MSREMLWKKDYLRDDCILQAHGSGKVRSSARMLVIELLNGGKPGLLSANKKSELLMIDAIIAEMKLLKQTLECKS